MKAFRRFVIIFSVLTVVLASFTPVYAIGFDAERIYGSVYVVYSGNSIGSGFAIGVNCIITNAHVITNRSDVKIETYSGEIMDAFVVFSNEEIDIAVIGVLGADFEPLKIANLDLANVGDDVYAIGAPNSLAFTLTKGIISSKDRYVGGQRFVQTDAAINSGNSGGPLLNDSGEVIGVNSYKMSDAEGLGLAIPIDVVTSYLETGKIELDKNGNVAQPVLETPGPMLPDSDSEYAQDTEKDKASSGAMILAVALVISIALNVTLISLLALQKRKNRYTPVPPSERTDFDIDILD